MAVFLSTGNGVFYQQASHVTINSDLVPHVGDRCGDMLHTQCIVQLGINRCDGMVNYVLLTIGFDAGHLGILLKPF